MKTLKFTVLLLTILIINSCNDKEEVDCCGLNAYQHLLWLGFQDEAGNDLLEGDEFIGDSEYEVRGTVKPKFYTLDIIYEDGIPNPYNSVNGPFPSLFWLPPPAPPANTDYNYISFSVFSSRIVAEYFAEKIIFRLKCPDLFDDNEAHDIVTWWEPIIGTIYTKCYLLEYDGKEFTVEGNYVATIVLEDK